MRLLKRSLTRLRLAPLRVCCAAAVCMAIEACGGSAPETPPRPSRITPTFAATAEATDSREATGMEGPTPAPLPTLTGPQVVLNGGFDSGIRNWKRPYGVLRHVTSEYHTGPGAARLTTGDETGFLEYRGNFGQCVDLSSFLEDWPVV